MDYQMINDDAYDVTPFLSYARQRSADRAERDPIVGDTVHFWDGERCLAAFVTQDDLYTVWLSCLAPGETSVRPVRDVRHDESKGTASWHWPCGGH